MNKKYTITIRLSYSKVTDDTELRTAIQNEVLSWIESGAFDKDLRASDDNGILTFNEVKAV